MADRPAIFDAIDAIGAIDAIDYAGVSGAARRRCSRPCPSFSSDASTLGTPSPSSGLFPHGVATRFHRGTPLRGRRGKCPECSARLCLPRLPRRHSGGLLSRATGCKPWATPCNGLQALSTIRLFLSRQVRWSEYRGSVFAQFQCSICDHQRNLRLKNCLDAPKATGPEGGTLTNTEMRIVDRACSPLQVRCPPASPQGGMPRWNRVATPCNGLQALGYTMQRAASPGLHRAKRDGIPGLHRAVSTDKRNRVSCRGNGGNGPDFFYRAGQARQAVAGSGCRVPGCNAGRGSGCHHRC